VLQISQARDWKKKKLKPAREASGAQASSCDQLEKLAITVGPGSEDGPCSGGLTMLTPHPSRVSKASKARNGSHSWSSQLLMAENWVAITVIETHLGNLGSYGACPLQTVYCYLNPGYTESPSPASVRPSWGPAWGCPLNMT